MYFIRYQPIKERLRNRTVTDREALPYFILFCVLETLAVSFPAASKMNRWDIVSVILNISVAILGVYYIYHKNGGSSGYDIIQKFVVLGWVVAIRYFVIAIPIGIIIYFIAFHFGKSGNETTLFDVVFIVLFSGIFYERLGRHIADTNYKNCEPANTADRLATPASR